MSTAPLLDNEATNTRLYRLHLLRVAGFSLAMWILSLSAFLIDPRFPQLSWFALLANQTMWISMAAHSIETLYKERS